MKKISMFVGLFILCMTLSVVNLYAACNISNGKIEVRKGGACQSIQTAINKADGVNPVLISVLPGTYTEQVIMKPYVTLVGSGKENTKITSSAAATVTGAANSSIENIWVDNVGAIVRGATSVWNVPNINNVKITVSGSNDETSGIRLDDSVSSAVVSNCTISVSGDIETVGIITGVNTNIMSCIINTTATATSNKWNAVLYNYGPMLISRILCSPAKEQNTTM